MSRRLRTSLMAFVGMLILILDAKTAVRGAGEGVSLCLRVVIPSLFPFFVLSVLLTASLSGTAVPVLRFVGKLCGIPSGAEPLLLIGLLGGYPAGAQAVAQSYEAGRLSRRDAERMLGFCSNAGPAFLFGMIGGKFSQQWVPWVLWGIHISSALTVGILLPGRSKGNAGAVRRGEMSLPEALRQGMRILASVCGWVVLFRVVLAFLNRWLLWLLNLPDQVIVSGVLELSNGCCDLDRIPGDGLRFVICSGMLAFGGLCVAMQTASVTGDLGMGKYLPGKLMQTALSLLMAVTAQHFLFSAGERAAVSPWLTTAIAIPAGIAGIVLMISEKKSSISWRIGV